MKRRETEMAKETHFENQEIKRLTNSIRVNKSDTQLEISDIKIYTSESGEDPKECTDSDILKQQQQQQHQQVLEPPDGGWGWMVACGVFLIAVSLQDRARG